MILRLEVGCGQRRQFAWFLRAARRHPAFRYERRARVAVLEFNAWADFAPYFLETFHRRYVRVFRDGVLVDRETAREMVDRARGFTRFGARLPEDLNNEAPRTARLLRAVLNLRGAPVCCTACGQALP